MPSVALPNSSASKAIHSCTLYFAITPSLYSLSLLTTRCRVLFLAWLLTAASVGLSADVFAQPGPRTYTQRYPAATAKQATEVLINNMQAGAIQPLYDRFSAKMKRDLPFDQLKATMNQIVAQMGGFSGTGMASVDTSGPYTICLMPAEFGGKKLAFRVAWNGGGEIDGFFIVPFSLDNEWTLPAYVVPTAFAEEGVAIGPKRLQGIVSKPLTLGKGSLAPAVVLIHGSGPQDKDLTIGGSKIFKDLAQGLASQGVAVLRYEKRTAIYGGSMSADSMTVEVETMEDAIAAVRLLRDRADKLGIDPKQIYIAGHSMGGHLAPAIAQQSGVPIAGIILLSANVQSVPDLVALQADYLQKNNFASISKEQLVALKAMVKKLNKRLKALEKPETLAALPDSERFAHGLLDQPLGYWMSLHRLSPTKAMPSLDKSIRFLIIQGERDYQLPPSEVKRWVKLIPNKLTTQIINYPKLNHLLLPGEGLSKPEEYNRPGHLPSELVGAVGDWVRISGK